VAHARTEASGSGDTSGIIGGSAAGGGFDSPGIDGRIAGDYPRSMRTAVVILACVAASSLARGVAQDPAAARPVPIGAEVGAKVGATVGAMEFVDIRYLRRTLADFGKPRACVLFFVTNSCPIVLRYLPRLRAMARASGVQVQFLAVNVGPGDSIREMAACAVEHDLPFPFVKDTDGSVARAVGVTRSATAVVLGGDTGRRLLYRGRIDQRYRFSGVSPAAGRQDLETALDEVLAGKPVSVAETPVEGCAITWPKPPRDEALTFNRDIAPLIQSKCQDCHRPDGDAPFPLLTYDDVSGRGEMIKEVVAQRRMPPWHASSGFGSFANHRGLADDEVRRIVAWVNGGMAQGDPAHLPPPRTFEKREWRIAAPDLVLKLPYKIKLPEDGYLPYKYFVFPYRFKHDTWVEQIEILPLNRRVLHHANLARVRGFKYEADGFITGQVPGGDPMILDPGTALLIPKGSVLAIQCHYVTTGKREFDRLRIGLRFPRVVVRRQLHHLQIGNTRFKIPAHASHHHVGRGKRVPFDAEGIGLFAHMHLRGKDMRFTAVTPGGTRETLLLVPNYNFEWQQSYRWHTGKVSFTKDTRIQVDAHFDNSAFNPFNPDPEREVPFGDRTIDEMMYGFVFFLRRGEDLNLQVDATTGRALGE
jgi:peroxiredoxin